MMERDNIINQSHESHFAISEFSYRSTDAWEIYANVVKSSAPLTNSNDHPLLILLHGGGPDHHSLVPLAKRLTDLCTVILPDIRGYGRSICTDPSTHIWAQYSRDVVALLDHLGVSSAIVGGAGLGSTISLRTATDFPNSVSGLVLISVEDIEDDEAKKAEIAFMEAFAHRVKTQGIEAGWEPILKDLSPIIASMVREAIPRSNAESIAAAAAIGYDRSFKSVSELDKISVPTLIIPGIDWRHPKAFAEHLATVIPKGSLASVTLSTELQTDEDFAKAFAPAIREFILKNYSRHG